MDGCEDCWIVRRIVRRSLNVKNLLVIVVAGFVAFVAVGCANNKTKTADAGVMDVNATSANNSPSAYTPAPQPIAAQPVTYDTMPSNGAANTGTAGANGSYTVKKGDTLYSIARSRYGDGKQWQKIASANPGLRPETLKVGQTITVP
jgi:5'-nucleotidase